MFCCYRMSESTSTPPPDTVHSLTSEIDRIKLSSANQDGRKSMSSPRSGVPTSLLPASGAPIHPTPNQPMARMEMPVPMIPTHASGQSLTMAYARSYPPQIAYTTSSSAPQYHQSLTPPHPTRLAHSFNSSIPTVSEIDTSFPVPSPARPRASSVSILTSSTTSSPSSSASASSVQCAGTTKAGKRCTRQVKAPPLLSYFTSSDHDPVERLCFQHVKEVLQPTGFYSRKTGVGWVEFSGIVYKYCFLFLSIIFKHCTAMYAVFPLSRLDTQLSECRHSGSFKGRNGTSTQRQGRGRLYLYVGTITTK